MMVRGDWKIVQRRRGGWQLFNLADDPGERTDLSTAMPGRLASMADEFDRFAEQRNYIEIE